MANTKIPKYLITDDWRLPALLAATFILQLPGLFFGFELCDSGFYMTFYDNIFSHPESVQYNFMYYLTGVAGGTLMHLTGGTLFAMRLAGMLCSVGAVWMVWSLVGARGRFLPVLCAAAVICAGNWPFPLTFYNDQLTMLLALASLVLLVKALTGRGRVALLLAASGLVAGINAFSRLPNILEVLFVLIIPLCATVQREGDRSPGKARMAAVWLCGWAVGIASVLLGALALGHLPLLAQTVADLAGAASSAKGDSSHSLSNLLLVNVQVWKSIVSLAVKLVLVALLCMMALRSAGSRLRLAAALVVPLLACFVIGVDFTNSGMVFAVALLSLSLTLLLKDAAGRLLRVAAVAALFMVAILPAGSDGSVHSAGPILLWLALPVGFCALCSVLQRHGGRWLVALLSLLLIAPCVVRVVQAGLYFDRVPVSAMTRRVNVPRVGHVSSSESNSARSEAIVSALMAHVAPGDTLLVYGSAPMLNFVTSTVPALGCSWPELLSPAQLGQRMEKYPHARYVAVMKVRTIGGMPENTPAGFDEGLNFDADGQQVAPNSFHNPEKSTLMRRWLEKNRYKLVVETPEFSLYQR